MRISRCGVGRAGAALLALVLVLGGTPALADPDKNPDIDFELSVNPHHEGKLYDREQVVGHVVFWHRQTLEARVVENGQNAKTWVDTGSGLKEVADPANPGTYQVQLNPAGEETVVQVLVEQRVTENGKQLSRYKPYVLVIYREESPQARGESPSGNKGTDSPLGAVPKPATPTESNPPPAEPPDDPPEYEVLADRLGVSRAFAETSRASEDVELGYLHYGGWMDHSFFFVSGGTARDLASGTESFGTFVHSMGNATGTNPVSGSATWKGAMAGFAVSDTADRGNLIEGDATVTIDDFDQPAVDVALTGLRDRNAGRDRESITWEGAPLTDGAFER